MKGVPNMENIEGDYRKTTSKRARHQYILRPGLSARVPILVAICIGILIFTSIPAPSNGTYPSIGDSGLSSNETSTWNNLQSNSIPADENVHVLWDMVHGNQAPSQFSNLIAEIGSLDRTNQCFHTAGIQCACDCPTNSVLFHK